MHRNSGMMGNFGYQNMNGRRRIERSSGLPFAGDGD